EAGGAEEVTDARPRNRDRQGSLMPSFSYSAINAQGVSSSGEIQASDAAAARDALRGSGLLAQWIEERGAVDEKSVTKGLFGRAKKVKAKSLQIFSRQFATMIE